LAGTYKTVNMAHIRQSRPDSATYKTVKAGFWLRVEGLMQGGQITFIREVLLPAPLSSEYSTYKTVAAGLCPGMAHIRQSRPDSGELLPKTLKHKP
jgi:hypothetical protein